VVPLGPGLHAATSGERERKEEAAGAQIAGEARRRGCRVGRGWHGETERARGREEAVGCLFFLPR